MLEKIFVNDKEYKIIKLLGKGKGGYSYLATRKNESYVLKQIHHEPCDYYEFGNNIETEKNDYKKLIKTGIKMPKMIDIDLENEIIIKEFIDGPTIYDLVIYDKMNDEYLKQIKEMCKLIYSLRINIDYFPTNFVVQNNEIYYIDFECNNYWKSGTLKIGE